MLEDHQIYSNDDPGLTRTYFTARSNLVPYAFVVEKGKTMDFSETIVVYGLKLATDDWMDKKFLLTSKLCPLGAVCPLPRGYIHVLSHEKNCIKSVFKDIFLKLATDECSDKTFLLTSKLSPLGAVSPCPGAYTCIKSWKQSYKIRLQRDFFETCNKWPNWQDFPVDIKISSQWGCQPLHLGRATENRFFAGVTVRFFPRPVFPRGRIRPAHFFPGEETD